MNTVYSSESFEGRRRIGWQTVIRTVFADLAIDMPSERRFVGRMSRAEVGALQFTVATTDSLSARRTARHIATDIRDAYLCLMVRSGELSVAQFGRECIAPAGSFTLLHLDSPYTVSNRGRVGKIAVKIPAALLASVSAQPQRHCGVVRSAREGIGRLAVNYIGDLAAAGDLPDRSGDDLSKVTLDLLGIALEADEEAALPGDSAVLVALRRRCKSYIRTHLSDPDLNAGRIAAGVGISLRYLHKCFESCDHSVAAYLRTQRLKECRVDLADPGMRHLAIAEIAYRHGFRNACHFSDAFKSEFGLSPREARRGS